MLPLLLSLAKGPAYTRHACTHWARTWPGSSCQSWALCKHFCACWGRAQLQACGTESPAREGAAPGFRHTTTTQACAHACLVCSSDTHPLLGHADPTATTTHISRCHPEAAHVSHARCWYTSASHMLPSSTHPGTPDGSSLILPPVPSLEVSCLAGRVNMQWESRAVQWRVCVPWCARSWGWPVPLRGACRVKLVS